MKLDVRGPGTAGLVAALLAASCCILPIALILAGVANAGLMMTTMRYEWITLPLGVGGLAVAWWLYFRKKQQCDRRACEFVGRRTNLTLLTLASLVVVAALLLRIFPSWTASLLQ